MIRAAALLIAAGAIAPLPAVAQTAAPMAADPARQTLGLQLAKLLNPEALTMAVLDRMLGDRTAQAMLADPDMKAMEERYPGILKAMVEAMKPILIRHLRQALPSMWDRLGTFFAAELSEEDLRAAIAFYGSPTGTRMIELMAEGLDLGPMIGTMASDGYVVTEQNLSATARSAAVAVVGQLTPAQLQDADRFGRSPSGQRVLALRPRMMQIIADWSNAPSPEMDAEIEAAVIPVMERFTGMKLK
ncbi:DUF2059 domain-containing protein [Sphingomonas sp. LB-2]|uniref:DUF2059 domain-containing protein n=1 Tax=Sphingomonas caeni TaxID=2984949 RepID=UPI00222E45CD|nr:DUF2059 domain-containing protein [Sphingomonas caeni]MCW3846940.1 DUF2059 domain-containing protein [Sphingomonas caeni]